MKNQKTFILVIVFVILVSSLQIITTSAQEGGQAVLNATPEDYKPSFGVEIRDFSQLDKAGVVGNHWLRYNGLLWSDYQPVDSTQFIPNSALEANMIATSDAGMEMILIIRSTPEWAQKYEGYFCGPMAQDFIDDFAAFMGQVVAKYSEAPYNVMYYELWNEPDEFRENYPGNYPLGCWGEPTDDYFGGGYYAQMLKQVYPAVEAANPEAQIVLGGLLLPIDQAEKEFISYTGGTYDYYKQTKFFEGILINGGGPYFDYANFHGYTTYDTVYPTGILMEKNEYWWADSGGMVEGKLNYLRDVMASYSITKPILMTEAALVDLNELSTSDITAFEAAKADYLVWVYSRNIARGIEGSTWYHLDNYGWSKSGLLDSANQPLPAYEAFGVLTTALDGAVYQQDLSLGEGILGFEYTKPNRIWVLFSEDGTQKTIPVPESYDNAYDLFGNVVQPVNDQISFTRPIYVELLLNTRPVAYDQSVIAIKETPVEITLTAYDADGDPLTWNIVKLPDNGFLSGTAPNIVYTPKAGFVGLDNFKFTVYDGELLSNEATVTIEVRERPIAVDDDYKVGFDSVLNVTAPGVLGNDLPDPNDLTAELIDPLNPLPVGQGVLDFSSDGSFVYTPPTGWTGTTSFEYKACDGDDICSQPATVTIDVAPSCLEVSPASLEKTLLPDTTGNQNLTLTNTCDIGVNYDLNWVYHEREGFEGGIMPPQGGWETFHRGSTFWRWIIVDVTVNNPDWVDEGRYAAWANFDNSNPSDEWLLTPVLNTSDLTDLVLSFRAYSTTTLPGATLKVWVTDEAGDPITTFSNDPLWDLIRDEIWGSLAYRSVQVDLGQFDGFGDIRIAWQYVGQGGQSFGLDEIEISYRSEFLWLSTNPIAGTIPASSSLNVGVNFNSEGMGFGDYYADIFLENKPYPVINVPVILLVRPEITNFYYLPLITR